MAKISEGSYSDKTLPVFICDFSPPRSPDPTYLKNAEKLGVDYTRFTTDQPLELALFDFLCSRMHLKRPVMRRQTMRAGQ